MLFDYIRLCFSLFLFILGGYLAWDLYASGFNLAVLIFCILSFVTAHFVKPKSRDDDFWFLDALEFVIDMPYSMLVGLIRFGRHIRDVDSFTD